MSAVTATALPQETPSKEAARALANVSFNKPKPLDLTAAPAVKPAAPVADNVLVKASRAKNIEKSFVRKYVGDVSLRCLVCSILLIRECRSSWKTSSPTKMVSHLLHARPPVLTRSVLVEPLLKATDQRFVLFPIKYHEVGRDLACTAAMLISCYIRSGKATSVQKHPSGQPRRWICPRTCTIGKTS